jgi:ankyrin repeat protein
MWGNLVVDHRGGPVRLPQAYADPVVILGPPVGPGDSAGVIQIDRLTPDEFEVRFLEWRYRNGLHPKEQTPYVVIERGRHVLADGSIWEAGTLELSGAQAWTRFGFQAAFPEPPALFLTLQTNNGERPATARARNVEAQRFDAALFEEEAFGTTGQRTETVGYLAVYSPGGEGSIRGLQSLAPYHVGHVETRGGRAEIFDNMLLLQEEGSEDREHRHRPEKLSVLLLDTLLFAQDVSARDPDTVTPRRYGLSAEDWRIAQWLTAVRRGKLDKIQEHIDGGIDLNAVDARELNALAYAIRGRRLEVVDVLIAAGADVNAAHPRFGTLLHAALRGEDMRPAFRLIDAGADVNRPDAHGLTPLMRAAALWNKNLLARLLAAGANPDIVDDKAGSAVTLAVKNENAAALRLLLAAGANVNADQVAVRTKTAGRIAIENEDLDILRSLLEAGLEVDRPDHADWMALFYAVQGNDFGLLDLLLSYGADVNAQSGTGSALSVAVKAPNPEMARYLLDHGAKTDVPDAYGYTPLHWAAKKPEPALFELLIQAGADPTASTRDGTDILALSVDAGFGSGVRRGLAAGLDPNTRYADEVPLLTTAARRGRREIVELLIAAGADVNALTTDGTTPLIAAVKDTRARKGQGEIVRLLLDGGADPKIKDKAGRSVMIYATAQWGDDTQEILKLLKKHR